MNAGRVVRIWPALLLGLILAACAVKPGSTLRATTTEMPYPLEGGTLAPETEMPYPGMPAEETQPVETQPAAAQTETPAASATAGIPTAEPSSATVSKLPDANLFTWKAVVSGLTRPVDIQSAGDGSGRLFIIEQDGRIRVAQKGQLLAQPFLDLTGQVARDGNEQGLLGLAFAPDYAQSGRFYVNYTDRRGNTVVARYRVSGDDPNRADPASAETLLGVDQPYKNHNGGGMVFGPDGYLYIGLGDGGAGGDPHGNGQSLDTLLGKLLRISVNQDSGYSIPRDNPFANGGGRQEIWAYGLRNPWRFTFDHLTGDLYIADVGQDTWEEIDFQVNGAPGGQNYGWNYREGRHAFKGEPPAGLQLVDPVAEYKHGEGCSVTGGEVYRGGQLAELVGVYLYGDYCNGRVWGLLHQADGSWQNGLLFETGFNVSAFGLDETGEIYLADMKSGQIFQLERR